MAEASASDLMLKQILMRENRLQVRAERENLSCVYLVLLVGLLPLWAQGEVVPGVLLKHPGYLSLLVWKVAWATAGNASENL